MKRPDYPKPNREYRDPPRSSSPDISGVISRIKSVKNLSEIDIKEIAEEKGIAEQVVIALKQSRKPLNTTQLRKFFDNIIRIKEKTTSRDWEAARVDFHMLRPNLAYARGRDTISKEFYDFCSVCLDKIETSDSDMTKQNYSRFVELMEAVVAYSKYYEKERV